MGERDASGQYFDYGEHWSGDTDTVWSGLSRYARRKCLPTTAPPRCPNAAEIGYSHKYRFQKRTCKIRILSSSLSSQTIFTCISRRAFLAAINASLPFNIGHAIIHDACIRSYNENYRPRPAYEPRSWDAAMCKTGDASLPTPTFFNTGSMHAPVANLSRRCIMPHLSSSSSLLL